GSTACPVPEPPGIPLRYRCRGPNGPCDVVLRPGTEDITCVRLPLAGGPPCTRLDPERLRGISHPLRHLPVRAQRGSLKGSASVVAVSWWWIALAAWLASGPVSFVLILVVETCSWVARRVRW